MSLVSDSAAKYKLKLQAMPMQELRGLLEKDLASQGYESYLTNMTETDLDLKVIKQSQKPTLISLARKRHKPLEIELMVNHELLDSHDLVTKQAKSRNSGNRQSSFMMYRFLFLGLFLASILISIFVLFVDIIISIIEAATPGWSSYQRSTGILVVSALILLWYIYIRPRVKASDTHRRNKSDSHLLEYIKTFIENLAYQAPANAIVRCWNCFEKIDQAESFCSNCGKQQD
ncbi:MAG: hypothetical protein GPJ54_15915 [Candidatus Heimdallarchaeota archaeon]|nr:hypothetical protein [Candidatus Heimdallarchaeota archaeon]